MLATRMRLSAAGGTVTLFYDTFTDTNGTAITAHTPDIDTVGGGWAVYLSSGFEIQSNKCVNSTGGSKGCICDVGDGDVSITCEMTTTANFTSALQIVCARGTSNFSQYVGAGVQGNGDIVIREGGTIRATTAGVVNTSTTYTGLFELSGTSSTFTINGQNVSYNSTVFASNTHCGFINNKTDMSFDDLVINDN